MRTARCFINFAGALLLGLATALLIANWTTADFMQPHDPVLQLPIRSLFWITSGIAGVVAIICLFGERTVVQIFWVALFSTNIAVYAVGIFWSGVRNSSILWGSVSTAFAIPNRIVDILVKITFITLLAGSYWFIFWIWWRMRYGLPMDESFLKMACVHCAGHIEFSEARTGQNILCPHCQTTIILRHPDNLKMSCFFCKGNIKFPSHALGQKVSCPHCKMEIRLKEPL